MASEGYPPVPPVPPAQPEPPAAQPYYAPAPPSEPPRRSRAWVWWTVGVVVLLLLVIGSCALPLVFLRDGDSMRAAMGDNGIAVIRVDGAIVGTGDTYSYVTPEDFLAQIERAENDPAVRAIVLRVDSPGGTVAASEECATYVKECTKPVVVSVGDVGASGAYMISSQADEIWANPGSSVGSIGVIAQIPNVQELLDTVGIDFQTIKAGKYKDAGSPYRPLTEEERGLIQGEVDEAYDQFIDIVAQGRKMDRAKVEELATGLTWSGEKAKELGLVDKIGTYRDALGAAAELGGIEGDYRVVTYEEDLGQLLDRLMSLKSLFGPLDASAARDAASRMSLPR